MMILALEQAVAGIRDEQFPPHLKAEASRVWELYQGGIIREMYFRQDQHMAVLVLECAGVDEAKQALATLPLVAMGLIAFEVIPLAPYPGFTRLFAR